MKKAYIFSSVALLAVAAMAIPGCDEAAKQCGFECAAEGVAEGNASITGEANIDAFFLAVTEFQSQVDMSVEAMAAPMARLKAGFGLDASASGAQLVAAIKAKYQLEGDITLAYTAPKCEVSAKATVEATAKCDASVDPGSVKAECSGSCEAEVKVEGGQVSCEGEAQLKCSAPSASVQCSGSCQGECKLEAAAACEGTCKGTCDGTCEASTEEGGGQCNGKCNGNCQGTCELKAGGSCSGSCSGECVVEAQGGGCEGGAQVKCQATPPSADAKVQCEGKCSGEITPPKASAECEASAKANAELKAECTPPTVDLSYSFAAGASADLRAEFEGTFLASLKGELAAELSAIKKAELVLKAGANVGAQAQGVLDSFKAQLDGDVNAKALFFIGCAIDEMAAVPGIMAAGAEKLGGQVQASGEFVAAFGG